MNTVILINGIAISDRLSNCINFNNIVSGPVSSYLYSADGERVWKFAGTATMTYSNGLLVNSDLEMDKTFYPTPQTTFDKQKFYKHYFIGSERISTSNGQFVATAANTPPHVGFVNPNTTAGSFIDGFNDQIKHALDSVGYHDGNITIDPVFSCIVQQSGSATKGIGPILPPIVICATQYYYHYNHQGSVALLTDKCGNKAQHLQYLPYGGTFVDQRPGSYSSTYTFSAKEKDSESGYTYFGARYYSDNMMQWLSVDPMSDKNASTSPYMYCVGNPIKYMDLYGMDTIMFNSRGYFGTPIPDNSDKNTYVRVSNKEFNANRINYKKNGGLRWYHSLLSIGKNEFVGRKDDDDFEYYYAGNDRGKANRIFSFFADNTCVEWSHSIWENGNEELNAIKTDHNVNEVYFPGLFSTYSPMHFIHSHPDGGFPSYEDVKLLETGQGLNPNFVSTIYQGGYYMEYNAQKEVFNRRTKLW